MDKKSTNRVYIFKILAILLPLVFLAIVEFGLRISNYGFDDSVFVEDTQYPEFIYLNPDFSKRYFLSEENATIGNREVFKKTKDNNTIRIFVLGASTAIGFPYYHNGSFHRMLQYRLQRKYPDQNIEIINLSLTAINSYALLDMAKEVVKYSPDAILVYTGHNEYYGAMGVASIGSLGGSPGVVRGLVFLRQFRFIQLLIRATSSFRVQDQKNVDLKENLMRRMAEDQFVPLNSKIYQDGINQFDDNISRLFGLFGKHDIQVFVASIVSNLRDQPPLMNLMNEHKKDKLKRALKLIQNDSVPELEAKSEICTKCIRDSADYNFCKGKVFESLGNPEKAYEHYAMAKEQDALRFRAPEEINRIINCLSQSFDQVKFVDIEVEFRDHAKHGIPGNDLMIEHLHPNAKGYALMADAFFKALERSEIFGPFHGLGEEDLKWIDEYPLTSVDSAYATISTLLLKEGWPFYEKISDDVDTIENFEYKIAGALAVKQIPWGHAMNTLYKHYLDSGNHREALRVTAGLILELPYDLRFYKRATQLADHIGCYELAFHYNRRAYCLKPELEWAQGAFVASLKMDRPADALPFIQRAMNDGENKTNLLPLMHVVSQIIRLKEEHAEDEGNIALVNQIAGHYSSIGNYVAAKKYIDLALRIDKKHPKTIAILNEIEKNS